MSATYILNAGQPSQLKNIKALHNKKRKWFLSTTLTQFSYAYKKEVEGVMHSRAHRGPYKHNTYKEFT